MLKIQKSLALLLLVSLVLALPSLAGGNYQRKEIRVVEEYVAPDEYKQSQPEPESYSSNPMPKIKYIKETVVIRELVKISPHYGFALGTHGHYPILAFQGSDYGLEVGYTKIGSDQQGLVRLRKHLLCAAGDDLTRVGVSIAAFPGTVFDLGTSLYVERYISPDTSLAFDIYPVKTGNISVFGDAVLSGRLYF